MALVQYGGGQSGDYWSRFQPHDDASGVTMAGGGFTGMGLPRDNGSAQSAGRGIDPSAPTDQWQTMGGQQPGAQGSGTIDQLKQIVGNDWSPQHLQQVYPQLQALGIRVQNDVEGRGDLRARFRLPSGESFDFGQGGWMKSPDQSDWTGGPAGDWSKGFGGAPSGGGGGIGQPGGQNGGILKALQDTPGYQFTVDQALQGVERSAAAKGTLTGGTLKALIDRAAGLASTRYDTQNNQYLDWSKLGLNAVQGNQ